ncbi:T9SS type B sorting domain-containing protein [Dyadobacter tibetensis]|uniref:T9SS type B sorting domain-containing protein n=1 Tax=Dyadobacter tibetensis TaxID=1211851 RepID=UPI0004BBC6D0|nr:gliding motility-associated C-terminal domain-containing protein [Dyadobacter tibetensis]
MMKIKFTLFFLLAFVHAQATHIVGGHLFFNASPTAPYNYNLGLTMYFDALNGDAGAEDEYVTLYIFRKRDNRAIAQIPVPKLSRKSITYANPLCGISTLQTFMITYALDVRLEVTAFSDPEGYYMIWDRCCRNNSITNIKNPGEAGSLFYLEIPPVSRNGTAFVNSSPSFSEIKGDYACVNAPFTFDFGGTDADGDSLTYTLITPRQGFSSRSNPGAPGLGASNYPLLTWADGIDEQNIIPGPSPLRVNSKTGLLSVTASHIGLYVFAVRIDEYRKGEKIGTVTRDFQLKVVDCPRQDPPILLFKPKGSDQYTDHSQIIKINKGDPNCFEVAVIDPTPNQSLKISGLALNTGNKYFNLLPAQFNTHTGKDTLRFDVCLDDCFVSYDNRPMRLELIAEDNTCPLPLRDTLSLLIQRTETGNNPPELSTALPSDTITVAAGKNTSFDVFCNDIDLDQLALSASGRSFALTDYGMVFLPVSGKGKVQQKFSWTPPCDAKEGEVIAVDFLGEDQRCLDNGLKKIKTIYFLIARNENHPPSITHNHPYDSILFRIDEPTPISFQVTGNDIDTSLIILTARGRDFDMNEMGMQFDSKRGQFDLSSTFLWKPDCRVLQGEASRPFLIDFIITDQACKAETDTVSMLINVEDVPAQKIPELPNVITTNGDGKNDCLILDDLPADHCNQFFIDFTVYNRWGKKVHYTGSKDNWCPTDISAGFYHYLLRYSNQNIKGGLTIMK